MNNCIVETLVNLKTIRFPPVFLHCDLRFSRYSFRQRDASYVSTLKIDTPKSPKFFEIGLACSLYIKIIPFNFG